MVQAPTPGPTFTLRCMPLRVPGVNVEKDSRKKGNFSESTSGGLAQLNWSQVSAPGVYSLGCALVAVRACLWVLLCCVHPITFLTSYLSYPPVIPSVRYTSSTLSCL
jgi:hypothetical protein